MNRKNIRIEITSLGDLGDGIGRDESGNIVFVPYSATGDILEVSAERKGEAFKGKINNIVKSSPERITPPCPYFVKCGGCNLQHISADSYRGFKSGRLAKALGQAGYDTEKASQIIEMPANSRRRVEFKLKKVSGEIILGLHEEESHQIVNIDTCLVLRPELEKLIIPLKERFNKAGRTFGAKSLSLTLSDTGIDLVVELSDKLSFEAEIFFASLAELQGISRIMINHRNRYIPIVTKNPIQVRCGKIYADIPPGAFLQATREAQDIITDMIIDAVSGCNKIADIFAGIGTYSFPLTENAHIDAFEGDEEMVNAMKITARKSSLKLNVFKRNIISDSLSTGELSKYNAVVINPPRGGAYEQAKMLAESSVRKIIMVSCNPATFARDAQLFNKAGYDLQKAIPIDQFVWSPHLEIIAVFSK